MEAVKEKIDLKAIESIRPVPGVFTLDSMPGREFVIRKISVDDKAWLKAEENLSVEEICADLITYRNAFFRFVYRLLEDKSIFAKKEVKTVDEDGNEAVENLGGLSLFKRMVCSPKEELGVISAFGKSMGASEVPREDNEDDSSKKKVKARLKK